MPGTVLVSAGTYNLVKELFEFNPRGPTTIKGKTAPIVTYEVLSPRAVPGKVRGLEGLTSPLVGRDAEFQLMNDRLNEVREGRGSFVAVVGEAGLGKSRLLAEVRAAASSGPMVDWLEGRTLSYEQAVTYYSWGQIIREAIGAQAGDAPEVVRERLYRDPACATMPEGDQKYLEVMLSVESDATREAVAALEGEARVEKIPEAAKCHLRARAEVMPAVIVLDDLHWADTASLELLLQVAELVEGSPLLIICLLRPDKDAPSWSAVEEVRERLGERLTAEFSGDRLVFRALEGDAESFGWREGEGFPLDKSYCKRVLDGSLPNVVPDARSDDLTKDLWVTSEANIGSYAAVPVMLSDERPYGTLCCVSHRADPRLRDLDLGLMEGVARELSRQIERGGLQ